MTPQHRAANKSYIVLFGNALKLAEDRIDKYYKKHGHDVRHVRILLTMTATPSCQGAIADALGYNRNVMVRLVDAMEKKRLVRRTRNPKNRKEVLLLCTTRGHALLEWSMERWDEIALEAFRPLTLHELESIRTLSQRILDGHK